MGTDALYVRFPDGQIRFGLYYSATDTVSPRLLGSVDEAFEVAGAWDLHYPRDLEGGGEPVEVASAYAGYFWWRATATRDWLTSHRDPFETTVTVRGMSDWLTDFFAQEMTDELIAEGVALDRAMLDEENRRLAAHLAGGGVDASG